MTGVLDELPGLSAEQNDIIAKTKSVVLRNTEDFRRHMRQTVNKENIQGFFDRERMMAIGVAGGAVAGAIL
jgi:adenylate kinase